MRPLLLELMEATENTEGFEMETALQNCARLLENPESYILLAKEYGRVVGFINFTTRRTILHPAPSGLIDELVVTKDSRNKGVGRQLIQAVIDRCKEMGCCEVEVSTEQSNLKAQEFYKAYGFEADALLFEIET